MGFKIDGLEQFQRGLQQAARKAKPKYRALLGDVGEEFLRKCARHAPMVTGELKKSFLNGQRVLDLNGDIVEAGTSYYIAGMVEDGHKVVIKDKVKGRGRRARYKRRVVGYAPGRHYMLAALEEMDGELPRMAEEFLDGLLKGAGF